MYQTVVDFLLEAVGSQHPEYLQSVNNLACLYSEDKKFELAATLQEACLETRKVVLGMKHVDTCSSMYNLGTICLFKGDYPRAEQLLNECLEVQLSFLPPQHRDIAQTHKCLAKLKQMMSPGNEAPPSPRLLVETDVEDERKSIA